MDLREALNMNITHKSTHLYLCALLFTASLLALPGAARADGGRDYVPDEIVVKLFNAADLAAVAADFGLDPAPRSQFGSRPIYVLRITDGEAVTNKAGKMAKD